MIDLCFAICSEIAERFVPLGIGFLPGREPEYRTRGRIDVEHVAVTVDHNYAVVNALQNGENGIVSFREAHQQPLTLDSVFDDSFEFAYVDVVCTDISLGAGTHRGYAPVLLVPG